MDKSKLDSILAAHEEWLKGEGGERADLREANLREADLREADLRGADIDFSVWPLWCGSFGVVSEHIPHVRSYPAKGPAGYNKNLSIIRHEKPPGHLHSFPVQRFAAGRPTTPPTTAIKGDKSYAHRGLKTTAATSLRLSRH